MATEIIRIPKINPIGFYKTSELSMYDSLKSFDNKVNYYQKFQKSDTINVQFSVLKNASYSHSAKLINVVTGVQTSLTILEKQTILNYTYYEINKVLTGIAEGYYIINLIINNRPYLVEYISEIINIKTTHENTFLLKYFNDENDFDILFNDTVLPVIEFQLRCEGGFETSGFGAFANESIYTDQEFNNVVLSSIPYFTKKLTIGSAKGIPNWLIEKINRGFSCNQLFIDNNQYTKFNNSKLEPTRPDRFYPFAVWIVEMIEESNFSETVEEEVTLDLTFLPALIKESNIDNTTKANYGTHPFKITSYDWTNRIIYIDKPITLPIKNEGSLNQYWQMYKVGNVLLSDSDIINGLIQLVDQINDYSFRFVEISNSFDTQDATIFNNLFNTGTEIGFVNPFQTQDPINLDTFSYSDADVVNFFPYYLEYVTDSDVWSALVAINTGTLKAPKTTIEQGFGLITADFFQSLPTETLTKVATLNGTAPYNFQAWMDTTEDLLAPGFVADNKVLSTDERLIPFIQKLDGHATSRASWMKTTDFIDFTYSGDYFNCPDVSDDQDLVHWHFVTTVVFKGKTYVAADISIWTIAFGENLVSRKVYMFEYTGVSFSDLSLTLIEIIGNSTVQGTDKAKYQFNYSCTMIPTFCVIGGKLKLFVEGIEDWNLVVYPTNVFPDIGDVNLIYKDYSTGDLYYWDGISSYITYAGAPTLFKDHWENGNKSNAIGLFEWDEDLQTMVEYISNPIFINVKNYADFGDFTHHQSVVAAIEVNNEVKALLCQSHGTNTYNAYPNLLLPVLKESYDNFLAQNNL